jgi:hypothetical protein
MHYRIMIRNTIMLALGRGRGLSVLSIITSAIFALISLFYVYTVGSYFKVWTVSLQSRTTYEGPFLNIYIFNYHVDHIVIAAGTVLWIILSVNQKKARWFLSSIYGGLAIVSAIGIVPVVLDIIALLSIPIILTCWIYGISSRRLNKKKVTNLNFLKPCTNLLAANYGHCPGYRKCCCHLANSFFVCPPSVNNHTKLFI